MKNKGEKKEQLPNAVLMSWGEKGTQGVRIRAFFFAFIFIQVPSVT